VKGKVVASVYKSENMAVGIRHADHVAPLCLQKLALTSPTKATEFLVIKVKFIYFF
jgi:hypothetical protein